MGEVIQLGDKIRLSGFKDEDGSTMVVVKKMIGNYVKRMDELQGFRSVDITLKRVHQHQDGMGGKHEVHVRMDADKLYTAEVTEFNLFVGLDKALKKVIAASS